MKRWAPMGLGKVKLERSSRPVLAKFAPKRGVDTAGKVADLVLGGALATAVYTVISPGSLLPNTPTVGKHPEAALALGLGLSGAFWLTTGGNVVAVSGAASTAFLYALSKIAFGQ